MLNTEHYPLVSVVIPTYNRKNVLQEAIESVLSQTYPYWEIIIVDDGSTDGTDTVVKSQYAKYSSIRYLALKNGGAAVARNRGAAQANGYFITFLDSDDLAYPTWLEDLVSEALASGAPLVSCGTMRYEEGRDPFPVLPKLSGGVYHDYRVKMTNAGAFMLRKTLFDQVGGYDVEIRSGQHTELGVRITQHLKQEGLFVSCVDKPLIKIIDRGGGSIRKSDRAVFEGSTHFLKKHGDYIKLVDQNMYFDYLNVAGVRGRRAGETATARKYLLQAIKIRPLAVKSWYRLLLTFIS